MAEITGKEPHESAPAAQPPLALLYPPGYADALRKAAARGDIERVDEITDELARLGYCRPRSDVRVVGALAAFTGGV